MGNFKRRLLLLLALVLLVGASSAVYAAESSPDNLVQDKSVSINGQIVVNGKPAQAPAPYIRGFEGNIMVPLRSVAEQLGMTAAWDAAEKKVQIGEDLCIWIGKDYYTKGGSAPVTFGPPPELTDNRTFVSLPFFQYVITNCRFDIRGGIIYIDNNAGDQATATVDSPAVKPPELTKNVTVSSSQELFDAIAPDICITIKAGVYDLSTVAATASHYAEAGSGTAALLVSGLEGLTLQAESGADVELVTPDMFSEVLMFQNCTGITLAGIKAGHSITGEYECDAGVLLLDQTVDVLVEDCFFYGCGSIGIRLMDCASALISATTVTDCSLRAVDLWRINDIVFSNCKFINNRAYGCVIYGYGYESPTVFIDCEISGNKSLLWAVVELEGEALFERCIFRDNALIKGSEPVFKGDGISLRDCEIEKNNFSGYWDDDVTDLGGNTFKN